MTNHNKESQQELPEFPDTSRITSPARKMTLGHLYALLDRSLPTEGPEFGDVVVKLMNRESEIASYAYQAAAGFYLDADDHKDWQKCKDDLTALYIDLGLAAGPHQMAEIIRDIEAQAVAQVPNPPPH